MPWKNCWFVVSMTKKMGKQRSYPTTCMALGMFPLLEPKNPGVSPGPHIILNAPFAPFETHRSPFFLRHRRRRVSFTLVFAKKWVRMNEVFIQRVSPGLPSELLSIGCSLPLTVNASRYTRHASSFEGPDAASPGRWSPSQIVFAPGSLPLF